MNYGSIGQIIGHEITHGNHRIDLTLNIFLQFFSFQNKIFEFSGFDDQGRQFDLNGNLVDWWQDDTEAKFASKAQCIIEQASDKIYHQKFILKFISFVSLYFHSIPITLTSIQI